MLYNFRFNKTFYELTCNNIVEQLTYIIYIAFVDVINYDDIIKCALDADP